MRSWHLGFTRRIAGASHGPPWLVAAGPQAADQLSPRSQFDGPAAPVDRSKATMRRPTPPSGPWVTLLRVAWLAILLAPAAAGPAAGGSRIRRCRRLRALLAETLKTVSWSLLVCVGVALGRVAAKGQVPLEGLTGLLAAPLALTAANAVQRASPRPALLASPPGRRPSGFWPSRPPNTALWAWRWSGSAGAPGTAPRAPGGRPDGRGRLRRSVPGRDGPVGPHPAGHPPRCWHEVSMSCCSRSAARWWSSSPRSSELTSIPLPPRTDP